MKILLVDDHPVVRKGIRSILEENSEFKICGEADEGNAAMKLVQDTSPDLIIVDIQLKGHINGLELVKAIKDRYPQTVSLVMSIDDGSTYAERAIRAGARGYVAKEEAPETIITAINTVMKGKMYLSPEISTVLASKHIFGSSDNIASPVEQLSNRELEIFKLIGKGYKRNEIAKELNININTIESHRRKIREKLNLSSSAELSKIAVQWNTAKDS
jgi:DNA-binding NarL/FixJ family response regulator